MAKELILGLGGTGGRVINYVAADLKKKNIRTNDGNISCAVIDRYCYEQDRIRQAGTDVLTLAIRNPSGPHPLKTYFDMYKDCGLGDWMPTYAQLCTDDRYWYGLQMRAGARLEFYDCLKNGTIRELEKELDKLIFNLNGERVRVTIVSSLAGGTGSGILVQVAMWLRRYFAYHEVPVEISGVLILPDVFIRTVSQIGHDERQCEVLRANAYATIRELNAITKIKTQGYKPTNPIKLDEVGFNSDDEQDGKPVFDRTHLIDYEVKTGSAFMSIIDYEKMIARIVCERAFGPIGDDLRSLEDNLFVRLTRSADPLYGSCGIANAVYPYESVLEYCALRATKKNLASGWNKIDKTVEAIIERQKKYKDDLCEFVDPRKEYVRQFDELSNKKEAKDKLLYNIRRDVNNEWILDEGDKCFIKLSDKIGDFIHLFRQNICDFIRSENPGKLSEIKIGCDRRDWVEEESAYFYIDDLKEFVLCKRKEVEKFIQAMDMNIDHIAKGLADSVCPIDMGEVNAKDAGTLLGLFTKKDEDGQLYFIHPIAIRYLLYKLQDELEEKKKIGAKLDHLRNRLLPDKITQKYEEEIACFDKVKTDTEEDALTYLDKKPWFMSESKFIKKYMDLYYDFNEVQFRECCDYAEYSLTYAAVTIICERVELLIKIVEDFFNGFDYLNAKIDDHIDKNIKDTKNTNQQVIYVCGSKEDKESIYTSLNLRTDDSNRGTNETVAKAFYERFCAKINPDSDYNKKYMRMDICEMLANEAIKNYEKAICDYYGDIIDLDLYSALCKSSDFEYMRENGQLETERSLRQERYEKDMRCLADKLTTGGAPFLNTHCDETNDCSAKITSWGFSPELAEACPELGYILGVNIETQKNEAYNKNELICYSEIVGVAARNIDKFNEMNTYNSYYASYEKIVNMMVEGVASGNDEILVQTPHLDKTWHKILPYITPEMQERTDRK